jgi:disulfide bond formation protein DsbB
MDAMLSRLRPHWPLIALLISAALLAGAHAFESFGGLAPCALCLKQRETHWIAAGAALAWIIALKFAPKAGLERLALFGVGAAFLLCFGVAAYHVAVENHWVIAQCDADADLSAIRPMGDEASFDAPSCDVIAWSLLGISMAGYNAILSAIAALISFALMRSSEARS